MPGAIATGRAHGRRPFATAGHAPPDRADPRGRYQAHQGRVDPRRQKKEVHGTVTHTLTPLHPYLTTIDLDCGPKLKVSQGHGRPASGRVQVHEPRERSCRSRSTSLMGPMTRSTWRSPTPATPEAGLHFVAAGPGISRASRQRSGHRARPRTTTTGSPATIIPTTASRPR